MLASFYTIPFMVTTPDCVYYNSVLSLVDTPFPKISSWHNDRLSSLCSTLVYKQKFFPFTAEDSLQCLRIWS